jgi:hypothetical protein
MFTYKISSAWLSRNRAAFAANEVVRKTYTVGEEVPINGIVLPWACASRVQSCVQVEEGGYDSFKCEVVRRI